MATKEGGGLEQKAKKNDAANQDFDLDADLARLKKSSYVLIAALIILVVAFFILMILSLSGSFALQQSTDAPAVLNFVYPVSDGVAATKEPTAETDIIVKLNKKDRLFEVKRIPGYVRVEWDSHAGWVESAKVRSRLEDAAVGAGLTGTPLDVVVKVELFQKDVLVSGKVVNNADRELKNINMIVNFLDEKRDIIATEQTTIATGEAIKPGDSAAFHVIGHGLLGAAKFVAYEIPALELAHPTAPITAGEEAPPAAAPAAAPAAPAAASPAKPKAVKKGK
jgi:hypothetical protein